jgi:hypothetical protein
MALPSTLARVPRWQQLDQDSRITTGKGLGFNDDVLGALEQRDRQLETFVQYDWQDYTPVPTNWTVGDGSILGRFRVVGNVCEIKLLVTLGTGFAAHASGMDISIPIPFAEPVTGRGNTYPCSFFDTGTASYVGFSRMHPTEDRVQLLRPNVSGANMTFSVVTATTPFTWVAGDLMIAHHPYEVTVT